MADKPSDRLALGQTEIPPVLRAQADVLPRFTGEQLESQLQTFDMFLAVLSPTVRPEVSDMLRRAAELTADVVSAKRIMKAALDVSIGLRAAEPYDHEAAMRAYQEQHRKNFPNLPGPGGDDQVFLAKIDEALAQIEPMAAAGLGVAESILRQLRWCRAFALGEPREERPGPFSMGMIATRNFDMWGSEPELASLINEVERLANIRLSAEDDP
ncbi:MAG: hypothetical protein FJX20_09735 [Alphaproteobacteria bacterium]|nr:hypothetical protein [Alphaproteobacteria bacterium]